MKILHYTIGFAPERTGGLVGYATDLMQEQVNIGHDVYALYPASQFLFGKKIKVKKAGNLGEIKRYKLINSLPLALFGGIASPSDFMQSCDSSRYLNFLKELKPDVIHIHSLIGLHKEFLEVAKDLNIKTVYTTHDYYGLAPLPSFYYNGKSFDESNDNLAWNIMSADALSTKKLRAFQLSFYPTIRKWMKKMNRNPKHRPYQELSSIEESVDYSELRNYYTDMFSLLDTFHFNSSLARSIFEKNLPFELNGKVISITNKTIKRHNIEKNTRNKKVVAFIGPDEEYKGYFDFLEYVSTIDLNRFEVVTYGHVPNQFAPKYIKQKGKFLQSELGTIYKNIDILIVPSKWKETFGLVVLEALSYGVTVYASKNIGAKDLLEDYNIFDDLSILDINEERNCSSVIKTINEHVVELDSIYEG
ncbi:glycosyltransferase [Streptococcus thermophilus]|uniref:glycosyltransferase n=1 Tax=Streptococcus thermophilus TaxID=1308 RepID=UPI0019D1EA28|nr:glycosyltransferase [Streptococcus thermophilus]MBN6047601.1 glycosyltransferase [Streptococcus thermophilus]